MKAEEAIKRIQDHMEVHHIGEGRHIHIKEALDMAISAIREQEEREDPKPLTMGELRKIDAPVWCVCKPFEGGDGYWCLCQFGKIITPGHHCFDVSEIQHWVFLRSKPKEEAVDDDKCQEELGDCHTSVRTGSQ